MGLVFKRLKRYIKHSDNKRVEMKSIVMSPVKFWAHYDKEIS